MSQNDERAQAYRDLTDQVLSKQSAQNRSSAQRILAVLFAHHRPSSILDVGCGLGTWLRVAQEMGVPDTRGLEGSWLDPGMLEIDPSRVEPCDLEAGFDLGRKFDLVISLEVAEHLAREAAERFVSSLAAHGDVVLFSAAIPLQGGAHHLNERYPEYWASLFRAHDFHVLDFIRPKIWNKRDVLWWLRQNTLVFAHTRALSANASLQSQQRGDLILSMVHPEAYATRLQEAAARLRQYEAFLSELGTGGTFTVVRAADGTLSITRQ